MSYMSVPGNFTTLPNETMRDRDLSIEAKGLLGYLRSHEPSYVITKERIYTDHPKNSKYALDKALAELFQEDYVKYTFSSAGRGRISRTRAVYPMRVPGDIQAETPEDSSYDASYDQPTNPPAETPRFPSSVREADIRDHVRPGVYKKTISKKTKEEQNLTTFGSSRATGKAMPIPEDYEPSPQLQQWAWDKHRLRSEVVDAEIEIFKDHHIAKGSAMKSWDAAARTWLARVNSFSRPASNGNGSKPPQSTKSTSTERAEQALQAGRDLAAKIAAGGPLGLLEGGGYQ